MVFINGLKALLFGSKSNTFLYVGIGVIVAVLSGVIYYQKSVIETQKEIELEDKKALAVLGDQLNSALLTNQHNEKEFNRLVKTTENTFKALEVAHKKELDRAIEFTKKTMEIKNVKKSDDGIVAPILSNTLKWLYQRENPNTKDDNKSKSGETNITKELSRVWGYANDPTSKDAE